jgi:RHS repeat-associated protein
LAVYTRGLGQGAGIGDILSRTVIGAPTAHYYYHYDGRGNVVQLTDQSQNIVANYQYDGFGNLTYSSGSQASANPYRYNTKWCHAVSGLCNYGYRWYNPSAGRWINRDPINEYGGTNLYAFVGNNPMNALDARGLCIEEQEELEILEEVAPIALDLVVPEVAVPLEGAELLDEALVAEEAADGAAEAAEAAEGGCFVAGTPVLMADGSHRAIEKVKAGELVISRDEKTGKTAP